MRTAASADGRRLAFGWLGFATNIASLTSHSEAIGVWQLNSNRSLWSAPSTVGSPPSLPDPVADFPDLAKSSRLAADAVVPGHDPAALALNRDGSRLAVVEYGVWGWVRNGPAIGKWDPPIHLLNFLPRQRGRLRLFDGAGRETTNQPPLKGALPTII